MCAVNKLINWALSLFCFFCWLKIEGEAVVYGVVRGKKKILYFDILFLSLNLSIMSASCFHLSLLFLSVCPLHCPMSPVQRKSNRAKEKKARRLEERAAMDAVCAKVDAANKVTLAAD